MLKKYGMLITKRCKRFEAKWIKTIFFVHKEDIKRKKKVHKSIMLIHSRVLVMSAVCLELMQVAASKEMSKSYFPSFFS